MIADYRTLLKSNLQSSNPFRNTNVMNDCRQIAGESRQKIAHFNSVNSKDYWTKIHQI